MKYRIADVAYAGWSAAAHAIRHACSIFAHSEPMYCAPSCLWGLARSSSHSVIAPAIGPRPRRAFHAARRSGESSIRGWGPDGSGGAAEATLATRSRAAAIRTR